MTDDIRTLIETLEANGQLDTADILESQQARIELLEEALEAAKQYKASYELSEGGISVDIEARLHKAIADCEPPASKALTESDRQKNQ